MYRFNYQKGFYEIENVQNLGVLQIKMTFNLLKLLALTTVRIFRCFTSLIKLYYLKRFI